MSARNNDKQGRFRCYTKAFRISPEENEILNRMIALSGKTKQDYIIDCLLNHRVIINGNPYVYQSLKNELRYFINKFKFIHDIEEISLDDLIILEYVLKVVISMKYKKEAQFKADKDSF